jgi:radical SAM protein with 4Fe4S-binding SPASM domain
MGVKRTIFSLYAASADLHDDVTRIPGSFDRTLKAVTEARGIGMATQLHFVPMSFNYKQLLPIVQLAHDYGINKVSTLRFVPQGRGAYMADSVLSRSQNLELRRAINEGRKLLAVRSGSPYNFLIVNEEPECCAGIDRMSIGPEYDIYPCDAFKQIRAVEVTGTDQYSKADAHSLKECWNRSPYLEKVRSYLTTQFPEQCVDCKVLSQCLSGCLAQKVLKNGTFKKDIDPMCLMR